MDCLITEYMGFLEQPIKLSDHVTLDNPKADYEIKLLANYIKYSQENAFVNPGLKWEFPLESNENNSVSWTSLKNHLVEGNYKNSPFMDELKNLNPFEFLAKHVVILRYDDFGFYKYHLQHSSEISSENSESPVTKEYISLQELKNQSIEKAISESYFVSLLKDDGFQDYESFILGGKGRSLAAPRMDFDLNMHLYWWVRHLNNPVDDHYHKNHIHDQLGELKKYYKFSEKIRSDKTLRFISRSLKSIDNSNSRLNIIALVSMLEVLVIKTPDANRYHIEDSIRKQFILKIGILMSEYDKRIRLEELKSKVKILYDQRSNIAHGNFESFENVAKKSKTANKNRIEVDIEEYTFELERFARYLLKGVLWVYLSNNEKIHFIKNN
ncbi:MAG: hypothetical protein ABJG47_11230 [Ekhidna sp.]